MPLHRVSRGENSHKPIPQCLAPFLHKCKLFISVSAETLILIISHYLWFFSPCWANAESMHSLVCLSPFKQSSLNTGWFHVSILHSDLEEVQRHSITALPSKYFRKLNYWSKNSVKIVTSGNSSQVGIAERLLRFSSQFPSWWPTNNTCQILRGSLSRTSSPQPPLPHMLGSIASLSVFVNNSWGGFCN